MNPPIPTTAVLVRSPCQLPKIASRRATITYLRAPVSQRNGERKNAARRGASLPTDLETPAPINLPATKAPLGMICSFNMAEAKPKIRNFSAAKRKMPSSVQITL